MSSYGFRDGKIVSKKEINVGKKVVQYVVPKTVSYSTGAILSGWNTRTSTAAKTNATISKQLPYPMPIVVCPLVAGTAGGGDGIRIRGYDSRGIYREEVVGVAATANVVKYSNYAYSKIVSLKPYPAVPAPKSTSVSIGYRPLQIGLPYKIDSASDILTAVFGSVAATTAWTVDRVYNKVTLATTATNNVVNITYLSKGQA